MKSTKQGGGSSGKIEHGLRSPMNGFEPNGGFVKPKIADNTTIAGSVIGKTPTKIQSPNGMKGQE